MKIFFDRKIYLLIVAVFVLLVIFIIGQSLKEKPAENKLNQNKGAIDSIAQESAQENAQVNEQDNQENLSAEKETADKNLIKVIRVIDGDTIEIEGGEKVRYIGIDTPETVDPRKPVQCFGVEASKKNKELVEGKMVRLENDITDRDKYNRLLRYIWVGDTFVNLELVKQGFAYSYTYPPDIKYQDQFVKAQQEAREAKRGLWSSCPAGQTEITLPPAESSAKDGCTIKGNISASGEKIYHLPGCGSYDKTKIDQGRGERWFCAESEAVSVGWRQALNCP